ncbi:hypothetical protein BSZ36_11735 [Rubricoccus marinus]|uniref:Secretion system C-terminal sorting domain-containing protein n=1 Tax=Rubricoccus marinus TaxID=716817 RepID=A0A259U194_9BACT|nr:hypothetical protein BSZ36_11735 [Rubricoccus marinus]
MYSIAHQIVASPCGEGVIVVGGFEGAGDAFVHSVALWSQGEWRAFGGGLRSIGWNQDAIGTVEAIASAGCDGGLPQFYVAGTFTSAIQPDGSMIDVDRIALWDGTAWQALSTPLPQGYPLTLAYGNGTLYVGGSIYSEAQSEYVGAIKMSDGHTWEVLGRGTVGVVNEIVADGNGGAYVSGGFQTVRQSNGLTLVVNGLAHWTGTEWAWIGGPEADGPYSTSTITAMTLGLDGALYVGGDFETFAQPNRPVTPARHLAKWSGSVWADAGPMEILPRSIALLPDGRVVVGASSEVYPPRPRDHLFIHGETGWETLGNVGGSVYTLALADSRLYLGGDFRAAGGMPNSTVAAYELAQGTPTERPSAASGTTLRATPNPARDATTLRFDASGETRLAVFDALGREVAVLLDGPLAPGAHEVRFATGALPAGVYIARLVTGAGAQSRTLTVVR